MCLLRVLGFGGDAGFRGYRLTMFVFLWAMVGGGVSCSGGVFFDLCLL